jgi:hypothetical protein
MGAPNKANVSEMKPLATGGVLIAPIGTTLPPETAPSGSVSIDPAFEAIGYLDQDENVTNGEERDSEDIEAWGGAIVLTVTTSRKETFSFKPIEQTVANWKLRFGQNNVTGNDANAVIVHDGAAYNEAVSMIVAEKLRDGRVHLTVIPKAQLDSGEDLEHSDSDAFGYGMSFVALAYDGDKTSYELYYTPTQAGQGSEG